MAVAAAEAVAVEKGRIRVWEMGGSLRRLETRCFEKVIFLVLVWSAIEEVES